MKKYIITLLALTLCGCGSSGELTIINETESRAEDSSVTESVSSVSEESEPEPAEEKDYSDVMPSLRASLSGLDDSAGLTVFGSASPSGDSVNALKAEIDKLSQGGHKVSLVMIDAATASGVGYNSDIPMCTQSAVKAVFIGALAEAHPEAFEAHGDLMKRAISLSDNDAYGTLFDTYGSEPLAAWCREAGIDEGFAQELYPRSWSARDMLKLWTKLYCFLNSGSAPEELVKSYTGSLNSAAFAQLGGEYLVQSKAGWENGIETGSPAGTLPPASYTDGDPSNDECAINDTGVVYTDKGPYLFVIFTDISYATGETNPLLDLTEALLGVQQNLMNNE